MRGGRGLRGVSVEGQGVDGERQAGAGEARGQRAASTRSSFCPGRKTTARLRWWVGPSWAGPVGRPGKRQVSVFLFPVFFFYF